MVANEENLSRQCISKSVIILALKTNRGLQDSISKGEKYRQRGGGLSEAQSGVRSPAMCESYSADNVFYKHLDINCRVKLIVVAGFGSTICQ
jgi:hypothetical protein